MTLRHDADRRLARLFRRSPVADLDALKDALGTTSRTTVFRVLSQVGYLTSYSHSGRFYTLEKIPRFDQEGLWAHGGALFSRVGTLRETIVRLVNVAPAGKTHAELRDRLRLKVQDTLRELKNAERIDRVLLERLYVYVSIEEETAKAQVTRRKELVEVQRSVVELGPVVVLEVLLEIIRASGAWVEPRVVVGRLRSRGMTVTAEQVDAILSEHGIQKKTSSRSRRSRR
jgi:hypothetical protein